jgi:hypothetical protein
MIFFFTKVNNLIFYAIIYFISLILIDDTFKVLNLTTSKCIFKYKVYSLVNYIELY